jgi:hypothetical protein
MDARTYPGVARRRLGRLFNSRAGLRKREISFIIYSILVSAFYSLPSQGILFVVQLNNTERANTELSKEFALGAKRKN